MWESYYRDPSVIDNNFRNETVPLQLNCTGHQSYRGKYTASAQRQDYYLFFLAEGEITVLSPVSGQTTMTVGSLIVFEKDRPFSYAALNGSHNTHYFAHFTGSYAGELLRQCGIPLNTVCSTEDAGRIAAGFEQLFLPFQRRDKWFDPDCSARLTSLLVEIGRMLSGTVPARREARLSRSLDHLRANFTHPVSIGELAAMDFLSESRYRTLFREITGQSPQEYIIHLRMNMACNLLISTDLPISQISHSVGWSDQRYFARLFRERYGQSPREFRRQGYPQ